MADKLSNYLGSFLVGIIRLIAKFYVRSIQNIMGFAENWREKLFCSLNACSTTRQRYSHDLTQF